MQNKKICVGVFVDKETNILIYDKVEEKQKNKFYLKLAEFIAFEDFKKGVKKK